MSYTELEHGYQGLRSATNQPIFYVGDIGTVQQGLVGPGGSSIYRSSNRSELSDGCVNDDGCLGVTDLEGEGKQVLVGICAMAKKSQSKPMKEILTRLEEFEYIKIVVIAEDVILKEPVEDWPIVDCLISFHSKGFPLDKAIQYAKLRNPFIINNLPMQYDIQDRRRVYSILEGEGIEIPRYAVLDRDSPDPKYHELVESEDHVEVNGVTFNKPFVEKPVSAEDHNIYIYYPTSAGGGSQRLFRKIGSRSSVYSPESRVRKSGSYIYEDFMPTDGTDVKVYTVGPDYAHAEARKSPALDGKVERDSEGKEIRYPVILSNAEKLISRKVCLAFKQTVCGFDLLRANGQSFVCDVNGFSFVKNSNKYYDDCAKILGNMILRELAPTLHIPWSVPFQLDDPPIVPTTFGKMMELRCVVAVIRHGDRTPKQKMKVEVRHPKFFEIFAKYDGYKHGHVKLKRPKQLQEILDTARSLLTEIQHRAAGPELEEKQGKLEQLKSVLEMYGHFSGINRKVQMKYQPRGRPRGSSSDDGNTTNRLGEPSLVLILKWGGELTPAGRIQAEELGRIFRCMYPGGQGRHLSEEDSEMLPSHGEYAGAQGLGLLRLHSTFRHDLKIYASDEGRVQMTAAAFAKGLLALEGELTPILVQMVKSANTNGLLDNDCDSSKYQNMVKNRLHELLQQDKEFTCEDREQINPTNALSINAALDFVKNPVRCCQHVHLLIQKLMDIVRLKKDDPKTKDAVLYHGETWELMGRRWGKIEKDFCTKQKRFDISKIPDIYDCIKYDLQHNNHTLQFEHAEELYIYSKYLADIVIPQEYGLTVQEKQTISQGICTPLLKKIRADLQRNIEEPGEETVNRLNPRYSHGVSSPGRHVRTRLYFTSESHVHSLLTVLRYGGLLNVLSDEQWRRAMEYVSMVSELNYMSQIVVMLYEDPTKDPSSEERFHVELHFSPGVNCCVQKNLPPGPGFRPHSRNESSHNLGDTGSGQESTSQCSTRIEEEDSELGILEDDVTVPPLEAKRNPVFKDTSPPLMEVDAGDSVLDSPIATSRAINMMDLDPNIMDEPYDSGFLQSSAPIPISARTVAGHEAARLGSQLAASQRQRREREVGVMCEPRARSYDHHRQDKPEKTADKLQYQSLDAVNKEASCRVSKSPKFTEIFRDAKALPYRLGKPVTLAHSISSPELVPAPKPTLFQDSTPPPLALPNSPLITLHNIPLASPRIVPSSSGCQPTALEANDANVPASAHGTTLRITRTDGGEPTSSDDSLLLRPPNAPKRYGRSQSAMTLPIIEISGGECVTSDRGNIIDVVEPLSDIGHASLIANNHTPPYFRHLGSFLAPLPPSCDDSQRRHRHHHHQHHPHHQHHRYYQNYHHYHYHHRCHCHHQRQHLHLHLNDHSHFSSIHAFPVHPQPYRGSRGQSLELLVNAPLRERSASLSPAPRNPYNQCHISRLITPSRELSASERPNFRAHLTSTPPFSQLGKFGYYYYYYYYYYYNCSCRSIYEVVDSSWSSSSSRCSDVSNVSSAEEATSESVRVARHLPASYSASPSRDTHVWPGPRLARSYSCPHLQPPLPTIHATTSTAMTIDDDVDDADEKYEDGDELRDRRSNSLNSTSTTSPTPTPTPIPTPTPTLTTNTTMITAHSSPLPHQPRSSKLHPSCSLDCLRTAFIPHASDRHPLQVKRCCTSPHETVAVDAAENLVDVLDVAGAGHADDDSVLWLGSARTRRVRRQESPACRPTPATRRVPDDPSHRFIDNDPPRCRHCPHPCVAFTANYPITRNANSATNHYYHHHHHHHHHHRPLLHTLRQQRSFSSPDTRPSIIQPDPTCTARRHRHSISGQMSYFKLLGYNVSKKLTGSANSLFSTAVISGSSSAPNLKDMVPPHTSAVAAIEGFGGVPPIRPLETLHNALSLRQLDSFLEMMTGVPLFRTPASSPPKFPSPIGPGPAGQHQSLGIDATRYIPQTAIQCKGSHENETSDARNQVSPTSPNSAGWSSEPQSFLSSEPSSPAPTSTGECSMSMSLISNDGSQPFSTGTKYSPNRCLDLDYNDLCTSMETQETRESRGSVSYTDYYSNEDGQIRRTANDNCFPVFVKLVVGQSGNEAQAPDNLDEADEEEEMEHKGVKGRDEEVAVVAEEKGEKHEEEMMVEEGKEKEKEVEEKVEEEKEEEEEEEDEEEEEEEDEEEDHTLTLKQSQEERKQNVQRIFEQKEMQGTAKSGSNYKRIGRFRVESTDISDKDVRIKELGSLGSNTSSDKMKRRQEGGAIPKQGINLLRSQSVHAPKVGAPSGVKSSHLPRQNSLTAAPRPEASATTWSPSLQVPSVNGPEEQPLLTMAGSLGDSANVTFGFDLTQFKKD